MILHPFSVLIGCSYGLKIPLEPRTLSARSPTVSVNDGYSGNMGFSNVADSIWTATAYVQGLPFQAQMDSASADFWVDTRNAALEGLQDTGVNDTVSYAQDTDAAGPIVLGNVTLGAFTVEDQAFNTAPYSNTTKVGADLGLMGLALPHASAIYNQLENTTYDGYPFFLFRGAPEVPPLITFLLSRSDGGATERGLMSIGEVAEEYAAILDRPKLPVVSSGWWETFMDGIYVNGEFLPVHSNVTENVTAEPGKNQSTVIFDTGTSLAAAPREYVDAIYKDVPGAVFNESLGYYTLPCDSKLNVSMVFGSNTYPMNPIDVTALNVNPDGSYSCIGAFFPTPATVTSTSDFILGAAFMRNVYTLMSVGSNFTGHGDEPPYIQILSTTDQDEAFASFDASVVRRFVQAEAQAWAQAHNVSMSEVASQTTTSGYQTASYPATSAGLSGGAAAASATPASSGTSDVESIDKKLAGHSVTNLDASSPGSSSNESELLRNSYIVLGLVAGAVPLLLGILIKLVAGTRSRASRQVSYVASGRPYDPEDTKPFVTPYDDRVRPIGSH